MDINDRVKSTSEFLGVAWTKGRVGTIVRKRNGIRGPVYGVALDGTSWVLDFDADELEPFGEDLPDWHGQLFKEEST